MSEAERNGMGVLFEASYLNTKKDHLIQILAIG